MLGICVFVLSVVRLCEHVTCVITCTPKSGWLGLMVMPDWWRCRSWWLGQISGVGSVFLGHRWWVDLGFLGLDRLGPLWV